MNKEKLTRTWHLFSGAIVILVAVYLAGGVYMQRGSVQEGAEGYLRLYAEGGPVGGIRVLAKMDIETVENNLYSNSKVYHVTGVKAEKEWQSVDSLCKISDHTGTDCTVDGSLDSFLELDARPEFNYGSLQEYEGP